VLDNVEDESLSLVAAFKTTEVSSVRKQLKLKGLWCESTSNMPGWKRDKLMTTLWFICKHLGLDTWEAPN